MIAAGSVFGRAASIQIFQNEFAGELVAKTSAVLAFRYGVSKCIPGQLGNHRSPTELVSVCSVYSVVHTPPILNHRKHGTHRKNLGVLPLHLFLRETPIWVSNH